MGVTASAKPLSRNRFEVEIGERSLALSNLDRLLFPETGFTKGDLIDYYVAIAPVLLPHLKDRPVTLRRFPEGVEANGFWEKNCSRHRPEWVDSVSISESGGSQVDYCLVEEPAALAWLANAAAVEIHTSLASADGRSVPDSLVFDLDPGPPAGITECCEVATTINGTLNELGLTSLVKTSGSKGLQVYVPLNGGAVYEKTKPFSRAIARALESQLPDLVVSRMKRDLREGRIFVDWSQNSVHKTTVSAYSVRALPVPSVSTPLEWSEVELALENPEGNPLRFSPKQVLERVADGGDRFESLLEVRQDLPGL